MPCLFNVDVNKDKLTGGESVPVGPLVYQLSYIIAHVSILLLIFFLIGSSASTALDGPAGLSIDYVSKIFFVKITLIICFIFVCLCRSLSV